MGFLLILVIILFFAGLIFVNIKINDFKYRAKQQVLRNTGVSSADINAGVTSIFEKKCLEKFLEEHPSFTEESIKDLFRHYTEHIINKNSIDEFSESVNEKLVKDSKLEKLQTMEFKRVNINSYNKSIINAIVVYTDNRDEYNIYLNCTILDEKIKLDRYQIVKGAVVGF